MAFHPLAGTVAPADRLVDLEKLRREYFARVPDASDPAERVAFGTSGHRGSSLRGTFNEQHVLAISQAICEYRIRSGTTGPLFVARDTHALSEPAFATALEVLAGNGVDTMIDCADRCTATPALSHAILTYNRNRRRAPADGIVITPSHNPPEDGGLKYNPPNGGPAETAVTRAIEEAANRLLQGGCRGARRIPFERARRAPSTHAYDYVQSYVTDLASVVDMDAIRGAGLDIGIDPLGGAGAAFWPAIADHYDLDVEIVNEIVDPSFRFMPLDWDGQIRMDCSSPFAMATLVRLKDCFDLSFGNDPDADRHGIVTRSAGLMNPNHYLAAAVDYLFAHRPGWRPGAAVGKTVVSSSAIDRVAARSGRALVEMPVGFKWFVPGLFDGSLGFAGEESAGASFLRRDGTVWVTEKDGLVMNLLAAELMARTGRDPSELYCSLTREIGAPAYERLDAPATPDEKAALARLSPADVVTSELGGDPIVSRLTAAPANGASIGGLKIVTEYGWFAARPSGTEAVYKLYAESFRGVEHLRRIQEEALVLIARSMAGARR
jgi:phosphoglucomutase